MSVTPTYFGTPLAGSALVPATAETSYTNPTHVATVVTAGTNGSRIEEVHFVGTGITLTGIVQLFLFDGTNYRIDYPQTISAVTPSQSVPTAPFFQAVEFDNLLLPTGWSLVAASFVPNQLINVLAFGGSA